MCSVLFRWQLNQQRPLFLAPISGGSFPLAPQPTPEGPTAATPVPSDMDTRIEGGVGIFFVGKESAELFTLPETNIFAPENGWLEYDCCLLGPGLFSGANLLLVSGRVIQKRDKNTGVL